MFDHCFVVIMQNSSTYDKGNIFYSIFHSSCPSALCIEYKIEPKRQTTITINDAHTGMYTCTASASILSPMKINTIAMPCCRYSNWLTAPCNRKNNERKPSTAKILLV